MKIVLLTYQTHLVAILHSHWFMFNVIFAKQNVHNFLIFQLDLSRTVGNSASTALVFSGLAYPRHLLNPLEDLRILGYKGNHLVHIHVPEKKPL